MYSCQSGPAPMSEPIFSSVNSYAFLTSSMPSGPLASFICTAQHRIEAQIRIRHHLVPHCPGTLPRELLGKLVCLPAVWLAGSCFGFLKPSISHCRALRHVIVDHAHACRMMHAGRMPVCFTANQTFLFQRHAVGGICTLLRPLHAVFQHRDYCLHLHQSPCVLSCMPWSYGFLWQHACLMKRRYVRHSSTLRQVSRHRLNTDFAPGSFPARISMSAYFCQYRACTKSCTSVGCYAIIPILMSIASL